MGFRNVYQDPERAASYATLEFANTYHLAFRDLPGIFERHAPGRDALDFGCGTGRSARFLAGCGYRVVGVDISAEMVALAREADPGGDYRLLGPDGPAGVSAASFDLVLAAFTFDNIPTTAAKESLLIGLGRLLRRGGVIVLVVSAPEIYRHEWASFTTRAFPENLTARSGDRVRIVMTDVPDRRPVEDILWSDEAWAKTFTAAGLSPIEARRPLARGDEGFPWVEETRIAPWVIYVLRPA